MYTEFKSVDSLAPFVECIWINDILAEKSDLSPQRILPDGCADLIFDLTEGRESVYWVGTMTKSFVIEKSESKKLIGIRFNPGGARSLLGKPLSEITDQRIRLDQTSSFLLDSIVTQPVVNFNVIQNWLMKNIQAEKPLIVIQKIHQMIREANGDVRVSEVSETLGLSRQYINRIMREHVGVDLKTFQQIIRMRLLTSRLGTTACKEIDWASIAQEYGFYDQSHLIHDFNEIVGLSPAQFAK